MHKTLLARNTSRDTLALTVVFHSITDSKREEDAFSVYQKIILPNTVCCKYEMLVALRRFHASSGKIYVYYLISISLKKKL